jgi:hypothetical protein
MCARREATAQTYAFSLCNDFTKRLWRRFSKGQKTSFHCTHLSRESRKLLKTGYAFGGGLAYADHVCGLGTGQYCSG